MANTPIREIRDIENVWIPMADGTRIAARIILPIDADENPVPAILEYLPYRKRDLTRSHSEGTHVPLAQSGYACVRAEIRGSGDSDGASQDEYVPLEQEDALEIIAWLAEQPWCTGAVGMFGISWGGFNTLQIAARRPPALKAIITHCGSDDRYLDDVHYLNGCLNDGMFQYGSGWTGCRILPPDPAIVGEGWRERWMARLETVDFHVAEWMAHQRRDEYWTAASVSEDYAAIECAVYTVGGWADIYPHTVARMLANLRCPRKGLVGPWGHQYPQFGVPGPRIDWNAEAVRWWDHWLKGIDTGIMDEPIYRVWQQEEPNWEGATEVRGRWIAERTWPSPRIVSTELGLSDAGLGPLGLPGAPRTLPPSQIVGSRSPAYWFPGPERDQREDDARSLVFDSPPLEEALSLLGAPTLDLDLEIDRPVGFLVVRLNEVSPDGVSSRLCYGVLNLTHRNGSTAPEPMEPGRRYRIDVQLRDLGQVIPVGHRLRLTIATASWPFIWPAPEPVTLTVHPETSRLRLPVRPADPDDAHLAPYAELAPGVPGRMTIEQDWDATTGILTRRQSGAGTFLIEATSTEMTVSTDVTWTITDDDPTSATSVTREVRALRREGWDIRCETLLEVTSTRDEFVLRSGVVAIDDGTTVFERTWDRRIPRDLM